jgi:hypothetical protein
MQSREHGARMARKRWKRILIWVAFGVSPVMLIVVWVVAALVYESSLRSLALPEAPPQMKDMLRRFPTGSPGETTASPSARTLSAERSTTATIYTALAKESLFPNTDALSPELQKALSEIERTMAHLLWMLAEYEANEATMTWEEANKRIAEIDRQFDEAWHFVIQNYGKPYWRWSVESGGETISRLEALQANWVGEAIYRNQLERGPNTSREWRSAAEKIGWQIRGIEMNYQMESIGRLKWPDPDSFYAGPARSLIDMQYDCLRRGGGFRSLRDGFEYAFDRRVESWKYGLMAWKDPNYPKKVQNIEPRIPNLHPSGTASSD